MIKEIKSGKNGKNSEVKQPIKRYAKTTYHDLSMFVDGVSQLM